MGVKHLWRIFPKTKQTPKNERLAIDTSIWLHYHKNIDTATFKFLTIKRILKLLHFNNKPVFVFDKGVLLQKKKTISLRQKNKENIKSLAKKFLLKKICKICNLPFNKCEHATVSNDQNIHQANSFVKMNIQNNKPTVWGKCYDDEISILDKSDFIKKSDQQKLKVLVDLRLKRKMPLRSVQGLSPLEFSNSQIESLKKRNRVNEMIQTIDQRNSMRVMSDCERLIQFHSSHNDSRGFHKNRPQRDSYLDSRIHRFKQEIRHVKKSVELNLHAKNLCKQDVNQSKSHIELNLHTSNIFKQDVNHMKNHIDCRAQTGCLRDNQVIRDSSNCVKYDHDSLHKTRTFETQIRTESFSTQKNPQSTIKNINTELRTMSEKFCLDSIFEESDTEQNYNEPCTENLLPTESYDEKTTNYNDSSTSNSQSLLKNSLNADLQSGEGDSVVKKLQNYDSESIPMHTGSRNELSMFSDTDDSSDESSSESLQKGDLKDNQMQSEYELTTFDIPSKHETVSDTINNDNISNTRNTKDILNNISNTDSTSSNRNSEYILNNETNSDSSCSRNSENILNNISNADSTSSHLSAEDIPKNVSNTDSTSSNRNSEYVLNSGTNSDSYCSRNSENILNNISNADSTSSNRNSEYILNNETNSDSSLNSLDGENISFLNEQEILENKNNTKSILQNNTNKNISTNPIDSKIHKSPTKTLSDLKTKIQHIYGTDQPPDIQNLTSLIKEIITTFNLPMIDAIYEADSQCAYLNKQNLVDAVITEDNDIFLYGGKKIYKNFFRKNKDIELYNINAFQGKYTIKELIIMSSLLGSDYTEGKPGFGLKKTIDFMQQYRSFDGQNFKNEFENVVDRNLVDNLCNLYMHSPVREVHNIEWKPVDTDKIYRYLENNEFTNKQRKEIMFYLRELLQS